MTKSEKEFKELTNIIENSYYLSKELSHGIATEILKHGFTKITKGYDVVKREVKETAEAIAEKCTFEPNKYITKEDALMAQTFCGLPIAEAVKIVEEVKDAYYKALSIEIVKQKYMPTHESVHFVKLDGINLGESKRFPFDWGRNVLKRDDLFVLLKETDIKNNNDN